MRGLVHFLSGLAAATFFRGLLMDVQRGCLAAVIPAACAYLPDFFDFKFWKFLEKWDYNVDPAPQDPSESKAPKLVKIAELSDDDRYRFYALKGRVLEVTDEGEKLTFLLDDGSGRMRVIALKEDREALLEALGGPPREGDEVQVSGYMDYLDGEKVFFVADAPHPMYVAERIARAIDDAYSKGEVRVKVQTIRMSGDVYRRYIIDLDGENRVVRVAMGPLVTVGGNPLEERGVPEYRRVAEARTKARFVKKYPKPTVIEAFSGPTIGFKREGDVVEEVFLPWHREWSHSFVTGVLVAVIVYILGWLAGYPNTAQLSIASLAGFWLHIVEDQLGFMGGNLFFPFTSRRIPGLGIAESGSAVMNFATAWLMISLMIANLNRFSPKPPIPLPYTTLVLLLSIPSIALYAYAVWRWLRERTKVKAEEIAAKEAMEEEEELGGA